MALRHHSHLRKNDDLETDSIYETVSHIPKPSRGDRPVAPTMNTLLITDNALLVTENKTPTPKSASHNAITATR